MQKSRKVWSKGLSFFMVLVLAFTSVFFNSTPINAGVQTEKKFSGANVGLDLLRVTGKDSPFSENANAPLKLIKGETYILTAKIGFQKEYGGGQWLSQLLTTIKDGDVKLFRNGKEKSSFDALTTASWLKNETDAEFEFIAGDDKINAATGEVKDFIEAKGKTGIWKNEIILSSYLIYNLKLKAVFYDEGIDTPYESQIVDWNHCVTSIDTSKLWGVISEKKFIGWYYKNEPNKKFDFDEPITDNVELVAKYEVENNNEQQEEVNVKFVAEDRPNTDDSLKVYNGSTFKQAKTEKQEAFFTAEKTAKENNAKNTFLNVEKYDWYTDAQYKTIANDNERINANKTYYGQLKKEKVNVTFYVNDTKQEIVKIEKGKTFTDAKGLLSKFNDFDNYDWFLDKGFKENVDKNKAIDTFITYYGKLKSTDNNNNNNNNGNNNNNNDNNNNGNNNNDNNNNNNNDNNNNNTTTPNTPSNDITIPEETTPLSPATTETSTTPATESKDNNDNIDIEDDDTALGTAVVDDKDATLPAKKENKVIAKKESSLNITSEDTPLGTTLPKTGGSFGIIYLLFGLILSAFGIKKFRER